MFVLLLLCSFDIVVSFCKLGKLWSQMLNKGKLWSQMLNKGQLWSHMLNKGKLWSQMLNNQGEFNDTLKEPFLFSSSLNLYTLFLCPTEGFFNFLISDFSFDLLNIPKEHSFWTRSSLLSAILLSTNCSWHFSNVIYKPFLY